MYDAPIGQGIEADGGVGDFFLSNLIPLSKQLLYRNSAGQNAG